ncbi:glycosyl transferase family 2 [Actinobacillus seminis]|uniref:Glycosyl transferase family 2 n=1 Tax=Actinobacillus seminis TaxID=722 RepID=A0A263HBY5_9PAST|nr:glycosyltransferase family 2 protein [Actinobacillus seminis]OZN24964.1 glycosyl transferase family 2 [Actinobacillus seminis]SUU36367.1 putative UDP-galactose--lipooligosaccharide galactosyltransferase [Actinobacillus seminis]
MDMNKLVSVLVPAYNVSSYVREALSSVLAQTYKHLEIIVIDDGSTDNTGEILNQLAKSDTRLRIIHNEKNIGIIKTLNKGLNLAKGDYIARMDADDLIVPDWIEKILNRMENEPHIFAMGGSLQILSSNTGKLAKIYKNGEIFQYPTEHDDIIRTLPFDNPMAHPTMVMRAEIFSRNGLRYDEHYPKAEDYKLWLEISKIGQLANLPDVLLQYRIHENQTSSMHNQQQISTARKIRFEAANRFFEIIGLTSQLPYDFNAKSLHLLTAEIDEKNAEICVKDQHILSKIVASLILSLSELALKDWLIFLSAKKYQRYRRGVMKKLFKKYFNHRNYGIYGK